MVPRSVFPRRHAETCARETPKCAANSASLTKLPLLFTSSNKAVQFSFTWSAFENLRERTRAAHVTCVVPYVAESSANFDRQTRRTSHPILLRIRCKNLPREGHMAESSTPIYFPFKLSDTPEDPLPEPLQETEYARLQIELVRAAYAKAAQLGETHNSPEVSIFLELFVNLIDTIEINNSDQAHLCMTELKKILNAVYPASIEGSVTAGLPWAMRKVVKH